jgi:hypothetical protein
MPRPLITPESREDGRCRHGMVRSWCAICTGRTLKKTAKERGGAGSGSRGVWGLAHFGTDRGGPVPLGFRIADLG